MKLWIFCSIIYEFVRCQLSYDRTLSLLRIVEAGSSLKPSSNYVRDFGKLSSPRPSTSI